MDMLLEAALVGDLITRIGVRVLRLLRRRLLCRGSRFRRNGFRSGRQRALRGVPCRGLRHRLRRRFRCGFCFRCRDRYRCRYRGRLLFLCRRAVTADQHFLHQTFLCVLMLFLSAGCAVGNGNARHAQIPRNAGRDKER